MAKLFNLYWPGMKPGLLICALYPFIVYMIVAISEKYAGYSIQWLLSFPVVFLLCASPIMLTKKDRRSACAKLHVNRLEKLSFLVLMFWIVVPTIVFVSLFLAQAISGALFDVRLPLDFLLLDLGETGVALKFSELALIYVMIISIVTVTLFYVVKVKKNRVLAGLIGCIILIILLPVLGGIASVGIYLLAYFKVANVDLAVSYQSYPVWILYGVVSILALIGVIYFIKLYKRLGKSCF